MFKVEKIIIHCSASHFGDCKSIEEWHLDRGWAGVGYHFIILNGFVKSSLNFSERDNGRVEIGRESTIQGAHCLGQNQNSLGICLIGDKTFTERQLLVSLPKLISNLMEKYSVPLSKIHGHREFNRNKSCPNIDMNIYRDFLRFYFHQHEKLEPYLYKLENEKDPELGP